MNVAAIGTGIWGFLKRIPEWVLWVIAALLFLKFVDINAERRGRRKESDKQEVETAKERERVLATAREEVENVQDAKDAALAAPDTLPEFSSADELRAQAPDLAKVILRRDNRDGERN